MPMTLKKTNQAVRSGSPPRRRRGLGRGGRFIATALIIGFSLAQTSARAAERLPPPGITIPDTDRQELSAGVAALRKDIHALAEELNAKSRFLELLPDIEIFHKSVEWALRYDEFFDARQVAFAKTLLQQGSERAQQLRAGQTPWLEATGLVVRGYRSKLDGSVQPYGLVIPATWKGTDAKTSRLLVWLAGRNEKRTELAFLDERESSPGQFTPADTIALHPYGRFCNATKFAGEVDVFEAMDAVRAHYPIDSSQRVASGNASCRALVRCVSRSRFCRDRTLCEDFCRWQRAAAVVGAKALALV